MEVTCKIVVEMQQAKLGGPYWKIGFVDIDVEALRAMTPDAAKAQVWDALERALAQAGVPPPFGPREVK